MEIYQIYLNLLYNPFTINNLRELEQHYQRVGMLREATAFGNLISLRFKNDNNTDTCEEPFSRDTTNPGIPQEP